MIKLKNTDTVLFIGDSITHGGRMNVMDLNHVFGHGFQEMICSRLGADNYTEMPKFVNKGVSGNTSSQILERYERDCLDYKPTVVNLLCGVNDASCAMNPDETLANIEKMLQMTFAQNIDVKFFICEPFYFDVINQDAPYENIPHLKSESDFKFGNCPRNTELVDAIKGRVEEIQKKLPVLAEKYGAVYVPLQDVFDNASKSTPGSYFIWDNVHPTMVGHRLMADRWFEVAEKALS